MSNAERCRRYRDNRQFRDMVRDMLRDMVPEIIQGVAEILRHGADMASDMQRKPSPITLPKENIPPLLSKERISPSQDGKNERAKPRRRLSPDWQPSSEDRAVAIECGLDPDAIADEFRDYWIGRGEPMADWSRTYRGWCRRQFKRSAGINGHKLSAVDKLFLGAARAADAVEARFRAREQADASLLDR